VSFVGYNNPKKDVLLFYNTERKEFVGIVPYFLIYYNNGAKIRFEVSDGTAKVVSCGGDAPNCKVELEVKSISKALYLYRGGWQVI
jgi:hypothetical protein